MDICMFSFAVAIKFAKLISSISFRVTWLPLGQSYDFSYASEATLNNDCPNASEATLNNAGK